MNGDGIGTTGESGPRRAAPVTETTRRVATGAGWLYAYRWLERLLDFLAIVVLARLLAPDDFGLVAIAASFVTIVDGLSAFDVDKALIRSRDDDRAIYDTAWTLSALRGLLAALCMWTVAPWVADARMAAVLRVLALGPILNGLKNPRFVTFERDLVYSRLAVLTIGAKVVSVGAMLVLAVAYRSYWALVLGQLAYAFTGTILSYLLQPYRPGISLARFSTLVRLQRVAHADERRHGALDGDRQADRRMAGRGHRRRSLLHDPAGGRAAHPGTAQPAAANPLSGVQRTGRRHAQAASRGLRVDQRARQPEPAGGLRLRPGRRRLRPPRARPAVVTDRPAARRAGALPRPALHAVHDVAVRPRAGPDATAVLGQCRVRARPRPGLRRRHRPVRPARVDLEHRRGRRPLLVPQRVDAERDAGDLAR